jgi:hypothetical protein
MKSMSLHEVRAKGYRALYDALGPLGMLQFLQQFDKGSGDYTKERKEIFKDKTLDGIAAEIKARKKSKP